MPLISGSQISDLTGASWRTVRKRLDAAGLAPTRDGAADMWESTTALRAVLVEAKPDGLDPQQERARKDAAQALKTEMENLRRAGQLMEASEVTAAWADHISSARSRLLAIPSKLPPLMEGRPAAAMQALLRTEINDALRELAGA